MRDRIKRFERVPASRLVQHPQNWRTHTPSQEAALRGILSEVGIANAVIAHELPDGRLGLIDGHLRTDVLSDEDLIPVLVLDVNASEADKLLLTMDPLAAMAGKDDSVLASLVESAGIEDESLQKMLADLQGKKIEVVDGTEPEAKLGELETLREEWGTESGQLWSVSGRHRLLCGDSTISDDVAKLLDGAKPFIMVTDPPYGVEYDPEWRNEADIGEAKRRSGVVANDERFDWTDAYKLFPGVVAYVWHADKFAADVCVNLRSAGFEIRSQLIWSKPAFAISRGHYHWQHEPCWYATRKGSAKWAGDRSQSTIWQITNRLSDDEGKTDHGTQKPLECMARPIRHHGTASDSVYDPFCGSGTTMLAAERLGRQCFAMELNPQYVAVILQRMKDAGCNCERIE